MRIRPRRYLVGVTVAGALAAGMLAAGASSAQAAGVSSAAPMNCCSFQSKYSMDDAMQQMRDFAANNNTTCTFMGTTVWDDPMFGRTYVVMADCNWPSA